MPCSVQSPGSGRSLKEMVTGPAQLATKAAPVIDGSIEERHCNWTSGGQVTTTDAEAPDWVACPLAGTRPAASSKTKTSNTLVTAPTASNSAGSHERTH